MEIKKPLQPKCIGQIIHKIFSKDTNQPSSNRKTKCCITALNFSSNPSLACKHSLNLLSILSPFWQSKCFHQCGDGTWIPGNSSLVHCCSEKLLQQQAFCSHTKHSSCLLFMSLRSTFY